MTPAWSPRSSPVPTSPVTEDSNLSVLELRQELGRRGLGVQGNKVAGWVG